MQLKSSLAALSCVLLAGGAAAQDKVSKPFEYKGYSEPLYAGSRGLSAYVPTPDNEQLAVDAFIPADGPARKAFPVVFQYTPYRRGTVDVKSGTIGDVSGSKAGKFFLSNGYAVVVADMRGTGASSGWIQDFMPQLAKDGKTIVDWIGAQPWCDGNVGMMGDSYVAWSQTATAAQRPVALKCIAPGVIPLDGFTGELSPGGVYLQEFFAMWGSWMDHILRNRYMPEAGIRPAKPVIDEDGDGDLVDEIPLDSDGDGDFLDEPFPPKYADGHARKHLYYFATVDHDKGNYDYAAWASKLRFIDEPSPLGYTMYTLSPGAHVPGLRASGIPIYHIGGWFDAFTRGTFELYATLENTNPSRLLMPPSYHDFHTGPYWAHFGFDPDTVYDLSLVEHLRFFDRYLKGIDNGIDREAPIVIFVMNGEGWRTENEWPLARQQVTPLYFGPKYSLVRDRPRRGKDRYRADFTHDSRYGENGGNRYRGIGMESPASLPMRTEKDAQCLVYTAAPLEADTEVTGHPVVHFWAASTTDDADFFVYLEDVDAQGNSLLVTEGVLRAGFAQQVNNDEAIDGGAHGIDVLPSLPWHGFEKSDYNPRIFAGRALVELTLDLNPTAWVFKRGHRIRVSIACADWPTFALHPALSPQNKPGAEDNLVPTIKVRRGPAYPSRIDLPVIPRSAGATP